MRVQLTWIDPNTQQTRSPTLETPVAFGCEFGEMPAAMKNKAVRRMVLASDQVAPFHAIMAEAKGQLAIMNRQDDRQTLVNGTGGAMQRVKDGDHITIGPFEITVTVLSSQSSVEPTSSAAPSSSAPSSSGQFPAKVDPFAGMAGGMAGGMASGMASGMAMGLASDSGSGSTRNQLLTTNKSKGESVYISTEVSTLS
ncbi:MAG: hypothetical protein AAF703_20715, partial [Cyanobacteria bacterium P01_D01_bin.105]